MPIKSAANPRPKAEMRHVVYSLIRRVTGKFLLRIPSETEKMFHVEHF
jgi:hypothetical protein